jgi:hypothetical protein
VKRRCTTLAIVLLGWQVITTHIAAQTSRFTPVGTIRIAAELIRAQGERAYLAQGSTLTVVDLSRPEMPRTIGAYTFSDRIWGFRVHDGLAYVGADRAGLGILDVAGNGTPTLRGLFKTPGQAKNVFVHNGMALVTDTLAGVDFVRVQDPARPALTGSAFVDGFSTDVVASGNFAYAADRPTGFYVFDLSKKDSFEPVGTSQAGAPNNTQRAQLEVLPESAGRRVVVLAAGGLLQLFDVTTPASPTLLPPFKTPGAAVRIALKEQFAYVADGQAGLQVVDFTAPASPKIVDSFKTMSPARDVAVVGSLVLVALANGEVLILKEGV